MFVFLQKKFFLSLLFLVCLLTLPYPTLQGQEKKNIRTTVSLGKETKVILPQDYTLKKAQELRYNFSNFSLVFFSRSFSQGEAVYLEITPSSFAHRYSFFNSKISFFYKNREIPLVKTKWGYRTLFGISPQEKLDTLPLTFVFEKNSEKNTDINQKKEQNISLPVHKVEWPTSISAIRIRKQVPASKEEKEKLQARLQAERTKKRLAFASREQDHFSALLSHPRDMHYITSEFWKQRTYHYYDYKNKKRVQVGTTTRVHRGLDLRGRVGDPIYAMANGKVVLAENLYYEGNFVLIDHGNRIFSGYMHLSKLKVHTNETVKAGQLLGEAGNSGRVAGAHLHVSIYMHGMMVIDPLSLLCLPIRN